MRIRVTFSVDDETRRAIAREIDREAWNGRKATRAEIECKIMDGAENSLVTVTHQYPDEPSAIRSLAEAPTKEK